MSAAIFPVPGGLSDGWKAEIDIVQQSHLASYRSPTCSASRRLVTTDRPGEGEGGLSLNIAASPRPSTGILTSAMFCVKHWNHGSHKVALNSMFTEGLCYNIVFALSMEILPFVVLWCVSMSIADEDVNL